VRPCGSCGQDTWACARCARGDREGPQGRRTRAADRSGRPGPQRDRAGTPGRPRRPGSPGDRRGGNAPRGDHGARSVRAAPGGRARPRPRRSRRHLPDREGRSSIRDGAGAGRLPPGHRWQPAPRRGPRADRDLAAFDVVSSEEDVEALRPQPRFGVAAQTTQPIERVRRLVSLLRGRYPRSEVQVAETVCVPTRLRQEAAEMLAAECDVTVVAGGAGATTRASSSRRADATAGVSSSCRTPGSAARVVRRCAGGRHHRGQSTPDDVIAGVEAELRAVARGGRRW